MYDRVCDCVCVFVCLHLSHDLDLSREYGHNKAKTQRVIDRSDKQPPPPPILSCRAREREMDGRTGGQTDRARAEKEDRGRRGLFIGWSDTRDRLMLLALRCLCIYKRWACITHAPDKQLVFAPPNLCPSVCSCAYQLHMVSGPSGTLPAHATGHVRLDMKGTQKEFKPAVMCTSAPVPNMRVHVVNDQCLH